MEGRQARNGGNPLLVCAVIGDKWCFLAAQVPWLSADECQQVSRPMYDSKNEDFVTPQEIHDAVASKDHFPKVWAIELWNDSTDLRRLEQGFGRFNDAIDEGDRMEDGIAGNKVFDVLKIVPGSQRPADLRHRAILSFSSSCVRTRPSATS